MFMDYDPCADSYEGKCIEIDEEETGFDDWFTGGRGYHSDSCNYEGDEV